MKKRIALLTLALLCGFTGAWAQEADEDRQVLVFRSTGEVDLFYANELDSITLSQYDADSTWHEEPVVQRFHLADSTLTVPIAEIDSVAFGSRNETVFQPGVWHLQEGEIEWIVRYDGLHLYYKGTTPRSLLPTVGQKLFAQTQERFPIGLCAVATKVDPKGNEIEVTLRDVELQDIFLRLFYAGQGNGGQQAQSKAFGPGRRPNAKYQSVLPVGEHGSVSIHAEASFEDFRVVAQPLRGYFHVEGPIPFSYGSTLSLHSSDELNLHDERRMATIPLGMYALVFTPELTVDAFVELNAELSLNLSFEQRHVARLNYTKTRGNDPVTSFTIDETPDQGLPVSQFDLTLNGEIYGGVQFGFDFNVLRETAGFALTAKVGPSLYGELGIGTLRQLDTYRHSAYGKGQLGFKIKTQLEGNAYTQNLLSGERTNHQLFSTSFDLFDHYIDLFPHYTETQSVAQTMQRERGVSIATKVDNDILNTVHAGFEIIDEQGEVMDSVFVGNIRQQSREVQGLEGLIPLPNDASDGQKLRARPVFHYAGFTVRAQDVSVLSDVFMQPFIAAHINGSVNALSGVPYVDLAENDSTLFIVGPYLPVSVVDTVFQRTIPVSGGEEPFITDQQHATLIGTWQGQEGDAEVEYTFNNDSSGEFRLGERAMAFTYLLNYPQAGRLTLYFSDNEEPRTLFIHQLLATTLQYRKEQGGILFTLEKVTY